MKRKRSYTLTDHADVLIEAMAAALGISKTAVLELAIREKAASLGIALPPDTVTGDTA